MKIRIFQNEHAALLAAATEYKIPLSQLVRGGFRLLELKPEVIEFIGARLAASPVEKGAKRTWSLECKLSPVDRSRVELNRNSECVSDYFRKNFGFRTLGKFARNAGLARRERSVDRVFLDDECHEYESLFREDVAGQAYERKQKGSSK